MGYDARMRRRLVIALALLSVALTGGTCEFRASSNHPVQRDPPESESSEPDSGLLVVVQASKSHPPTADSPLRASIVGAALATSVLSMPSLVSTHPVDAATPSPRPPAVLAVSAVGAEAPAIANAVPEPGAVWLYAAGSIFLAWGLRPSR